MISITVFVLQHEGAAVKKGLSLHVIAAPLLMMGHFKLITCTGRHPPPSTAVQLAAAEAAEHQTNLPSSSMHPPPRLPSLQPGWSSLLGGHFLNKEVHLSSQGFVFS